MLARDVLQSTEERGDGRESGQVGSAGSSEVAKCILRKNLVQLAVPMAINEDGEESECLLDLYDAADIDGHGEGDALA